ncbi:MAG: U32 family peptidase [Ruminococcus sp.]|jgi:putative protease|nr:U32 family peptidase [Ruminococcus sp.]
MGKKNSNLFGDYTFPIKIQSNVLNGIKKPSGVPFRTTIFGEEEKNIEILSPAGSAESLNFAVKYGADAVYLSLNNFTMRSGPENFTTAGLAEAVKFCHENGVRVYLICNTLPRNWEVSLLDEFISVAKSCGVDALIVSDIGIFDRVKHKFDVHISTQFGVTNYQTANTLHKMGAKRVVLARELSLTEIAEIRAKTSPELELEAFVHGAMCVAFSGRCLLSAYLTGRNANLGDCAQPCRWGYNLTNTDRSVELYEGEGYSYILNSKDLCMIEHIGELAEAGITSFKIEGRAKSFYYTAVITNAYKLAAECYKQGSDLPEWVLQEVFKVSHREYCTGFYFGEPEQVYADGGYVRTSDVIAITDRCSDGRMFLTQRNRFFEGDEVEFLSPGAKPRLIKIEDLRNEAFEHIEQANHAMEQVSIATDIEEQGLLRITR